MILDTQEPSQSLFLDRNISLRELSLRLFSIKDNTIPDIVGQLSLTQLELLQLQVEHFHETQFEWYESLLPKLNLERFPRLKKLLFVPPTGQVDVMSASLDPLLGSVGRYCIALESPPSIRFYLSAYGNLIYLLPD